jgi:halocyanin-like protein
MEHTTRRRVLRGTGVVTLAGLAGCTGNGGGGDGSGGDGGSGDDDGDGGDGGSLPGEEYPDVDEWLTETEVGGADDTYEGTLVDWRDQSTLTVEVGAEGNGGNFAFDPSAVVVSAGTEVRWEWTGEGNPHNVEALPEEQLGKSTYEFSSGEAEGGTGVKHTRTLDEPGLVLYHCEPHFTLGMKGGIAVE